MDGAMKENVERDAWKGGQKAEARGLLRGLLHDPTFVDYFNIFLNQPPVSPGPLTVHTAYPCPLTGMVWGGHPCVALGLFLCVFLNQPVSPGPLTVHTAYPCPLTGMVWGGGGGHPYVALGLFLCVFLNQPVFGQRALFKLHSKTFIFNPPVGARIDNLRVIDWIHEERYNAFTRSRLSYDFQLCQQLRKISLSFRFDCKDSPYASDPDVNGPKMLSVLVTNLMGSAAGMYLFRQFLRGTVGARVITCWMHVQTFRKTRNPERRMELFRGIRRYYLHPVSVVSAVGGCWTDIVASDLLNFPLIPVEDSVLKARINGSEPLSPRELEPRACEALERVQSVLVAALQSYWLPCYILHVLGSQNVHVLKKLCAHCRSRVPIAEAGCPLQKPGAHCRSRVPIAGAECPLQKPGAHCRSCVPIAEAGCPLQKLCAHCRSCVPIAEAGCPLQKLGAHYRSCVTIAEAMCPLQKLCAHCRSRVPITEAVCPLQKLLKTSQDDCVSVDTVRKLVQRCSLLRTTPKDDDPAADDSRDYPSFSLPSISLPSLPSVRSCTTSSSKKVRSSSPSSSFLDLDPATSSPRLKLPPLGSDLEGSSTACKSDQSLGGDHSTEDTGERLSWMDLGTEGESVSSEVTLDVPASPLSSGVAVGEEGELTSPVTKAKEPSPGDLLTLCGGFPLEPQPSVSNSSNNSALVHQVEPPPIKKDTSPKPRATTPIDDDSSSSVQSEDSWSVRDNTNRGNTNRSNTNRSNTNRSNTGSSRRDRPGTWQGGGPFGADWVTGHRDNHTPACSRGAESRVSDASCPNPRLSKHSQDRDTSSLRDSDVTLLPGDSTDSFMLGRLSAESSFTSTSTAYLTSSSYWSADSFGSALDSSSGSGAGPGPEAGNLAASGLQHHNKRASVSDLRDSNRNARKSHCSAHVSSERRRTVLPELYDNKQQDYDFYSSTYSDSSAINTQRSVSLPALYSPREPFPFRGMCHPTFTPAEPAFSPAGRKTRRCSVSKPREVRPLRETERRPLRETERSPLRQTERSPPRETERRPLRETERRPLRETERSPPRETERRPLRETERRPPRETERRPPRETERRPLRETERRPLRETKRRPPRETERRPLGETERKAGQTPSETVSPFKEASRSHTASDHSSSSGSLEMNNNYNKADGGRKGSGRHAKTLGNLRSVFSQSSSMTLSGDHLSEDDSDDHLDGSGSHATDLKRERKKKLLQERVEKERKRDLDMQAESMRKAFEGWKKEELRTANIANLTKIALHDMALKHEEVKLHSSLLIHYIFGARDLETEDSKTDRRTLCLLACDSSAGFPLRDYMLARNQDLNINYLDFWTAMRRYIQLRDLCCTGEVTSRENQTQIFRLLEQQVNHVSGSFLSPSSCWSSRDYLLSAKFRRQLQEDLGQKRHSTLINSVMDVIANVSHVVGVGGGGQKRHSTLINSVMDVIANVLSIAVTQYILHDIHIFHTIVLRSATPEPELKENSSRHVDMKNGLPVERVPSGVFKLAFRRQKCMKFKTFQDRRCLSDPWADEPETEVKHSALGKKRVRKTASVLGENHRLRAFQYLVMVGEDINTSNLCDLTDLTDMIWSDFGSLYICTTPRVRNRFLRSLLPFQRLTRQQMETLTQVTQAILNVESEESVEFDRETHGLLMGPQHKTTFGLTYNRVLMLRKRRGAINISRPPRPKQFQELLHEEYQYSFFRLFLLSQGPGHVDALNFWKACEEAKATYDVDERERLFEIIRARYLMGSRRENLLVDPDYVLSVGVSYYQAPEQVLQLQHRVREELEKKWWLEYVMNWPDLETLLNSRVGYDELWVQELLSDETGKDHVLLTAVIGDSSSRELDEPEHIMDLKDDTSPLARTRGRAKRLSKSKPQHLRARPQTGRGASPPGGPQSSPKARATKRRMVRMEFQGDEPPTTPLPPLHLPSPPSRTPPSDWEEGSGARRKKFKLKRSKNALPAEPSALPSPPTPTLPVTSELEESARAKKPKPKKEKGKEPHIAAGPFPLVVRPGATFLPPGLRTIPLPRTHFDSPSVSGLASSSDINTPEYGEGADESSKTMKVEISECPEGGGPAMAAVVQKMKKTKRDKKGRRKAKDFEDEAAKKRRKKRILYVWLQLAKVINAFTSTLRDPIEMRLFEEYLRRELERTQTNQGDPYNPDKPTLARVGQANMVIVVNKLPSDLRFWCEVDRYKHQVLEAEEILEEMPEEEENLSQFLAMRATAIINCYLNSVFPPMVQVNISDQEAYRITYMYAKHGALHSLFHGAFVRLTPLLMTFWKQYQFESRNQDTVRAKGGKVEVAHSHVGNMPHLSEPTPDYTHCTVVDYHTTYVDFDDTHLRTGTGKQTTLAVSGSSKAPSPQSPGADSKLSPSRTEGEGESGTEGESVTHLPLRFL
ncbi:hypothetical protein ACOMHN_018796 [Nucella lapillus]